jgi:hypothetical protein
MFEVRIIDIKKIPGWGVTHSTHIGWAFEKKKNTPTSKRHLQDTHKLPM